MSMKNATVLAACALAGTAVAAVSLVEPPSVNTYINVSDGDFNTNTMNQADQFAGARPGEPVSSLPSLNDPAFWPSLNRHAPPRVDPADVPTGVDTGVNDPDSIGSVSTSSPLAGTVNCTCTEDYFPGDLVVAAVNFPGGNPDIPLGTIGTVVCGRFQDGGELDLVLVDWGMPITGGHDGFGACDCPVGGAAAAGQGWYVYCFEIAPFTLCVCTETFEPGDTVYATVEAPDGNGQIRRGDSGTVVCGSYFLGGEQDLVLVEWNINNGHEGNDNCICPYDGTTPWGTGWFVYCSQITKTPPIDCVCPDEVYFPGETMYSIVDGPGNNGQILAGDPATVICGDELGNVLLGEWNINNGNDGFGLCTCPVGGAAVNPQGWWVPCAAVRPLNPPLLCGPCPTEFGVGDIVWARTTNPSGKPDIQRGWRGTVICGSTLAPHVLVEWDFLTTGHNGNGNCDCPGGAASAAGQGWFVECNEISRAPIPCPGDTNFDEAIDVQDLLKILADWGPCPGCLSDMNGDDVVDVQDLLIVLGTWGSCP